MTIDNTTLTNLKNAVALRAVRGALGITQGDMAELIGVSKPTIARLETLGTNMGLEDYSFMVRKLKTMGVSLDSVATENVEIKFEPKAMEVLFAKLSDPSKRRTDRVSTTVGVGKRSVRK